MYKKVLLINPPNSNQDGFSSPPLGLLYLASALRSIGAVVKLYDGYIEGSDKLWNILLDFNPDAVCITCLTLKRHEAFKVADICKKYDHNIFIIMGGVHPSLMWQQVIKNYPNVDVVVIGEGEETVKDLVQGEKDKSEIPGIAYRVGEGRNVYKTIAREQVKNLDDIAYPAWDLVDLSKYPAWGNGIHNGIDISKTTRVNVIMSRGCIGHCSFCSTHQVWQGYRVRSPENMIEEIQLLYDKGVRHFCFADDVFTVNKNAVIKLCQMIVERKLKIAFYATTRTDLVDRLLLYWMKEAGCYELSLGIETASPKLLKEMGKHNSVDNNLKAIQLTKEAGIRASALLIVGNIGETQQTIDQTVAFLRQAKPDGVGVVGGLWVLPGTALYTYCKSKGYICDEFWLGPEEYMLYTQERSRYELNNWADQVINYSFDVRIKNLWNAFINKIRR